MRLSTLILVVLVCIFYCIENGMGVRTRVSKPVEDLTEGVSKTSAKDAQKIHKMLEESSKKVKRISVAQEKADESTKSTVISEERARSGLKLLLSLDTVASIKEILNQMIADKASLRK